MLRSGASTPTRTTRYRAGHCAGWHAAGGASLRVRIESSARCQSIRAHGLEDPRGLYQRQGLLNCSDARLLSLARHGIRLASLRWRSERPLAAATGPASPLQQYYEPARRARRDSFGSAPSKGWQVGRATSLLSARSCLHSALLRTGNGCDEKRIMKRGLYPISVLCTALLSFVCPRASPLDHSRQISQYGHNMWRIQDGYLPGPPEDI